jgi:hypothetical protein
MYFQWFKKFALGTSGYFFVKALDRSGIVD